MMIIKNVDLFKNIIDKWLCSWLPSFNFVERVVCHWAVCDRGIMSCRILDSGTVQVKGVSANAYAVAVFIISIQYRVPENQRSSRVARVISCRSAIAGYINVEVRIAGWVVNDDRLTEGGCHKYVTIRIA